MSAIREEMLEAIDQPTSQASREESFKIQTQEQAIWALRKITQLETRRSEAHLTADDEIGRIKLWLAGVDDKADSERAYFTALLSEYMFSLKELDPKLKTLKLPGGKLQIRAQQPELIYDDNLLLPWAKENLPGAVQVKETILKTPIKEYLKETGEVVPGITVQARPDAFKVEVGD